MAFQATSSAPPEPASSNMKKRVLLFLHGSGDIGPHFRRFVFSLSYDDKFSVEDTLILFPTAPQRPYSPLRGQLSNVWFDRPRFDYLTTEDPVTLAESIVFLDNVLAEHSHIIAKDARVFLIGFSMGGSMALHYAFHRMRHKRPVHGVFVIASFIAKFSDVIPDVSDAGDKTDTVVYTSPPPIAMVHGTADVKVLPEWGAGTAHRLQEHGFCVQFTKLNGLEHDLSNQCVHMIAHFLDTLR